MQLEVLNSAQISARSLGAQKNTQTKCSPDRPGIFWGIMFVCVCAFLAHKVI